MPSALLKLVLGCVAGPVLSTIVSAAGPQASGPQGDTHASIAKLPDWSGVWVIPFEAFAQENARQNRPGSTSGPHLTPEFAAVRDAAIRRMLAGGRPDETAGPAGGVGCGGPGGMPHVMRFAFGVELLFTPGRVTMLLEQGPTIRRIFTDGRKHTSDPDLSWAGESIGHWEGDTLVVDTTGISPMARLTNGIFTSGNAHVTERIRRTDRTHLQIDTVVEDPVVLQTPWRYSRIYERSDGSWFERYCDRNRDGNDSEPDLTPPK
jgi:hypothetical protein